MLGGRCGTASPVGGRRTWGDRGTARQPFASWWPGRPRGAMVGAMAGAQVPPDPPGRTFASWWPLASWRRVGQLAASSPVGGELASWRRVRQLAGSWPVGGRGAPWGAMVGAMAGAQVPPGGLWPGLWPGRRCPPRPPRAPPGRSRDPTPSRRSTTAPGHVPRRRGPLPPAVSPVGGPPVRQLAAGGSRDVQPKISKSPRMSIWV